MLYRFVDQQKACGLPVERICEIGIDHVAVVENGKIVSWEFGPWRTESESR